MHTDLPLGALPPLPQQPTTPIWTWLPLTLLLAAVTAALIVPSTIKCHCGGPLRACKSNCKNIATALEMYASDNKGRYPRHLTRLIRGNYLRKIPTCPTAGRDTYSQSYRISVNPDSFSYYCTGNNHAKAYSGFRADSTNYPKYDAEQGIIDHP
ncbi:hypothetical protein IV102_10910 [bacterium]|nr:hypothetical protein [bacterium]